MDGTCSPPVIRVKQDGTTYWEPHCWSCAPRVAALHNGASPSPGGPAGVPGTPKRRDPWKGEALARFIIANCRGTGRSIEWIIQNFSGGSITKEHTPEEFLARRDNLYVRMPALAKEIERLTQGKLLLTRKHVANGFLPNGKPKHHQQLLVKGNYG